MGFKQEYITMRDKEKIYLNKSTPENQDAALGIICIVHGSCEHSKRYSHFINYLASNGYIVYSYDLRGHGLSSKKNEPLGYFGEKNGWNNLIYDLDEIIELIRNENKRLKLYLLGHSMGSFVVRHYAIMFSGKIDGLIAIGTAHNTKFILNLGEFLANGYIKMGYGKNENKLLNKLSYDSFNKGISNPKTDKDWISSDEAIVDKFIKDEYCGFIFTTIAFRDMFKGLKFITNRNNIKNTRRDLPIILLSGADDPVGSNGKMVKKAYHEYKNCGIQNIQIKLYDGMRHEVLNENGKEEVYQDILTWINNNKIS